MIPTLSQVCSLDSPFEKDVEDYSAGACRSLEVWLTKLETYLLSHSVDEVRELLVRHGVEAPVASFQGGLLASQGEARREHWAHFERRLPLCQALGMRTLVVACDVPAPLDAACFERVMVSLAQAAELARLYDVRLALEFQSDSALGNNLQTAASMVAQVAHPALGICLDLFHFHRGPSKTEDLLLLDVNNLFHVQLSDILDLPREFASDSDRILPGEGDIDVEPILRHLVAINYQGCVSVEVLNPRLWQVAPRQFGEIAMTALRRLLGQASMGEAPAGE